MKENSPDMFQTDPEDNLAVARTLSDLGHLVDAQSMLVDGLRLARKHRDHFRTIVEELAPLYLRTRNGRAAQSCGWYLGQDATQEPLGDDVPLRDRARGMVRRGMGLEGDERLACHAQAAEWFERDGRWMHGAQQWASAGEYARSFALWGKVARTFVVRSQPRVEAYCLVSEARMAWLAGEERAADAACARAVELLRRVLDGHVLAGRADEASDCYGVLEDLSKSWERPEVMAGVYVPVRVQSHPTRSVERDLLAWENGWEIAEQTADWMVHPSEEVSPELALELRLLALATEGQPSAAVIQGLSRLARGLGDAGFEAIGPLELLYRRRAHWVRVAVVQALGQLPYPRAFRLLIQALSDSEPSVVRQAQRSIAGMRNPQLLESVLGLFASGAYARGYPQDKEFFETRRAAIEALAAISLPQARDAVRWIREQGSVADRRILGEVLGE